MDVISSWPALRESVSRELAEGEASDVWRRALPGIRRLAPSPAEVRQLWDELFASWPADRGPAPMWFPESDRPSNIARLLSHAQLPDYDALYRWSISEPAEFWDLVVRELEVPFETASQQTLDVRRGAEQARWFPDARLNIVRSCFLADPDAAAIVHGGADGTLHTVTYAALQTAVHQVANSLAAHGFQTGDRLAIVMPMTVDAVVIYLGILAAGGVVVSIADSFAAGEIQRRLTIANTDGVFCVDAFQRAGKTIEVYARVQDAQAPKTIVLDGQPHTQLRSGDLHWSDFLTDDATDRMQSGSIDRHINILFSSGTTGDPKAIPWNQTTPLKCAADGRYHQDIQAGDVVVWPTNLGWMMGPWLIFASLMNRATIGLYDEAPMGEGFGRFVQDARVNMLGVVPTLVRAWRASACMEAFDWSAIRCFSSTGEASNASDMFYLSSLAGIKPVIEYCGGTEIGGGYITSSVAQPNAPAAFSTAALGSKFVILNEASAPSDEGELFLVPPAIGLSAELLNRDHHQTYYEGTPAGPDGECLRRHGDHFRRLPGGYFVAGGRVDDTMNLGGIKISSAEIERVLNRVTGVRECAAVADTPADGGPDQLIVFWVADSGERPDESVIATRMNQLLKTELNPLFRVRHTRQIDSMPRTASNKVMRRHLRDQWRGP